MASQQPLSHIVQRVIVAAQDLDTVLENDAARLALLDASRQLTAALLKPDDAVKQVAFSVNHSFL
jgi:hypothetical protein